MELKLCQHFLKFNLLVCVYVCFCEPTANTSNLKQTISQQASREHYQHFYFRIEQTSLYDICCITIQFQLACWQFQGNFLLFPENSEGFEWMYDRQRNNIPV